MGEHVVRKGESKSSQQEPKRILVQSESEMCLAHPKLRGLARLRMTRRSRARCSRAGPSVGDGEELSQRVVLARLRISPLALLAAIQEVYGSFADGDIGI